VRQTLRGNVLATGYPRGPADAERNRAPVPPAKTLRTMARLAQIVPALSTAHVIRVWSGIEGYMPDMLPVIGPSDTTAGLFHAVGFCGHGFQLAPAVGLVLSEQIAEGRSAIPLEIYAIGRFSAATATMAARHDFDFDDSMVAARPSGQAVGRA
jgi:sarcosine oxidase subunit beta